MQVLISVDCGDDAHLAAQHGADIVDVKTPGEGSLGAAPPWLIREVAARLAAGSTRLSAAIGDLHAQPSTAALAASAAATLGADIVKAGMRWIKTVADASRVMRAVARGVRDSAPSCRVVAGAFGDWRERRTVSPWDILEVSAGVADGVLLDTAVKDGRSLFDWMSEADVDSWMRRARQAGLEVALAGSLGLADLQRPTVQAADYVGVRGAVCSNADRSSPLCDTRLVGFLNAARQLGAPSNDPAAQTSQS